jgi:cysteine synthase A
VLIEPTSGNTGIALAFVAAAKGIRLILVMPESMSIERRKMLALLGAELVLTPAEKGMKGAIAMAQELLAATPGHQSRPSSTIPPIPKSTASRRPRKSGTTRTARWTWSISGVGTGGTITGVGQVLKARKPSVRMIAVEPADSPVLSGGQPGPHKIQGIGAGFIPAIVDRSMIDGVEQVTNEETPSTWRARPRGLEGIPVGISSGAALTAAFRRAALDENAGKTIVAIIPSFAERYLSTALFEGL